MAKYTNLNNITLRLQGRLTFSSSSSPFTPTIGSQDINSSLVDLIVEQVEDWLDSFLGLIYELPLIGSHSLLNGVAEKLVISEILLTYYENLLDPSQGSDKGFGATLRQQALATFQSLFNGTGIIIPEINSNISNAPGNIQLQSRFIPLPGERLKTYIGYDNNGDGIPDTNLFSDGVLTNSIYVSNTIQKTPTSRTVERDFNIDWFE